MDIKASDFFINLTRIPDNGNLAGYLDSMFFIMVKTSENLKISTAIDASSIKSPFSQIH
jgi:hypothetical protein